MITPFAAGIVAVSALLAAGPSAALEPFAVYDNFNAPTIDPSKWPNYLDSAREIVKKQLHLYAVDYGGTNADTDIAQYSLPQYLPQPVTGLTELRALITVNAAESTACAANPSTGAARARIYGAFFNAGPRTAGSSLNDVTAQLRIVRNSNSTDAPGVLRVQGVVYLCLDSACANTTTVGELDMGTAALGQAILSEVQWDQPNHRFLFTRDSGTAMPIAYTQADTLTPGHSDGEVSARLNMPNCTAAPRPVSSVDATFDNFSINSKATP